MPIQPKQQPPFYQSGVAVKEFIAIAQQSSTNAPTILKILKNTYNAIPTFQYITVGVYEIDLLTTQEFIPENTISNADTTDSSGIARITKTYSESDPSYMMIANYDMTGTGVEINGTFQIKITTYV